LNTEALSVFLLHLRLLTPPDSLILKGVEVFFPQKAGDIR
jgi:hypothetical protein